MTKYFIFRAPEVIRNEKCSEKIDVYVLSEEIVCLFYFSLIEIFQYSSWSFGIVLWELLTSESPYRGVESSRIIIGIGYNQLKLHLPSSCPDGLKLLMTMCWSIQPQNRSVFF